MRRGAVAALLAGLVCALAARTAVAADCAALPSPVYVTGSTAAKPLLAEIGKLMAGQSPPATVVYLGQGSCTGVDAILSGTPVVGSGSGALSYWDVSGVELKCDVAAPGVVAHVGISDVFATTCFQLPGGLPPTVADILGPVQAMTFAAHKASIERAISAEAAYYIYGFGAQSAVPPWTFDGLIFRRDAQSGTQRMIAAAIGVPPERWKGTATSSSGDLVMRLGTVNFPDSSIGILSAEVAQDNRGTVRILAYQHFGQSCAVFPDRDEQSNDKSNVRNGLYPIWGPLHFFIQINASGYPTNAKAGDVVGYLAGTRPTPRASTWSSWRRSATRYPSARCASGARRRWARRCRSRPPAPAAATTKRSRPAAAAASPARPRRSAPRARRSAATDTASRSSRARRRGVRLSFFQVAALPRFARSG